MTLTVVTSTSVHVLKTGLKANPHYDSILDLNYKLNTKYVPVPLVSFASVDYPFRLFQKDTFVKGNYRSGLGKESAFWHI